MKYIRTEDGIYSYEPTHDIDVDGFVVQHNLRGWNKPLMKEDIIKIVNTIEELFDCVVYDCLSKPHQSPYHKHEIGDVESLEWNKEPERFENIYGAIWTDKGLIYKAKMKGILPNGEIDWELI